MTVLEAVVLGVTQGITEFLPISSDGHLIIVPWLFGWERFGLGFDVVLHAATLGATIAYFRKDVWRLARGLFSRSADRRADRRQAWLIIGATVPSALIALAFEPLVERVEQLAMTSQVRIAGWFLLLTSLLLGGAELLAKRARTRTATQAELPAAKALAVGVAQGFAVAPGLSRSGITIAAGTALGMPREDAAHFSFLLSIPIIGAALAKKLLDVAGGGVALPPAGPLVAGIVTTAVVGYGAIAFLLPYVRKHTLWAFAVYTALAGTAILVTSAIL